ncbi:MAG: inorganic phosphate transporter [Alphaproteobacteria bacterium]|nr:inorganic phosphate transporter [Alphaproteobacteria bacterium]
MTQMVFLLGALILAVAFGRNSVGNVFGSAIGTGMLPLRLCAFLMGIFIALGAFVGIGEVSESVSRYVAFTNPISVFYFSVLLALLIFIFTYLGLPLSVAQMGMGGLAGWHLATNGQMHLSQILILVQAWIFSPLFSAFIAFVIFKIFRYLLKKHPVSLLNKELWIRFHMVWIGCLMAYTIGANNLSVIIQPFTMALTLPDFMIKGIICLFVGIGCLLVSRRVIKTISADLFPLNSVEALMMTLSAGLTLLLFSFGFSYLPAIPISSGAALIGAIVGISLAKGGYGLKVRPLIWVASSWMWVPFLSGLTCFAFVSMIQKWGVL